MRALQSILDEVNIHHINLFSLDTERYEYNILRGIDFNRTTFDYMLIEIYVWDYETICTFLAEKGYDLVEYFSFYGNTIHNDYLFKRRGL